MDTKRFIAAIVVSFLFLTVYSYIGAKYFPKNTVPLGEQSKQPVTPQQAVQSSTAPASGVNVPQEVTASLPELKLDNFTITYSAIGGYVSFVKLNSYPTDDLLIKDIGFTPADRDKKFSVNINQNRLIFTADNIRKEFIFEGNLITIKVSPFSSMVLFHNILSANQLQHRYQGIYYSQNLLMERMPLPKVKDKLVEKVDFAGSRTQYFCASLIKGEYDIQWAKDNKNNVSLLLVSPLPEVTLYVGPQLQKSLQPFGLQSVIHYGFFHGIGVIIVKLFSFCHDLTKSWGLGIIILAILIFIILFPLTNISTRAMKKMQAIQPHIEELKVKYKDNPQKLNSEILELYKTYRVNPIGGCLPVFLQFPLFFALYQVFLSLTELKGAKFLWIKDLTLPDHAIKLGFPPPVDYINIIPLLIMGVGLVQQRFTVSPAVSVDQRRMGLFFSVFIGVIFYNFPSSLALYWFIQNFLTLLYQIHLARSK
jgi:YidC/Oxa1 family membrane protein insertase